MDAYNTPLIIDVKRSAFGANCFVGNFYDIFEESVKWTNRSIDLKMIKSKLDQKIEFKMIGVDASFGVDTIFDLLDVHQHTKLRILFNHYNYVPLKWLLQRCFLKENAFHTFHFVAKIEYKIMSDTLRNDSLQNVQKHLTNNSLVFKTHIVTGITYGLFYVVLFHFENKKRLKKEHINHNFTLVEHSITKLENMTNVPDDFLNDIHVDFYSNFDNKFYESWSITNFYQKLKSSIECTLQPNVNLHYFQISFQLTHLSKYVSHTRPRFAPTNRNLAIITTEYYTMLRKRFSIESIQNDITSLKDLFNENIIERIQSDQEQISEFAFALEQELQLVLFNNRFSASFQNMCKIISGQRNQELRDQFEKMAIFYDNQAKLIADIRFYASLNIQVLGNKHLHFFLNSILDESTIIFAYNQHLKDNQNERWQLLFGRFISLSKEQPDLKYFVHNFDIANEGLNLESRIAIYEYKASQFVEHSDSVQVVSSANDQRPTSPQPETTIEETITNDKDDINIILLGESGVGKSTFINAFLNYNKFATLDDALSYSGDNRDGSSKLDYLIPSKFSFTDKNCKSEWITVGESANETFIVGQSSTQSAQMYEFTLNDKRVRIIDTPGMGDSRGIETDKSNFDATIAYLSKFTHLNAICFLIKPNNARLQPGFRYCFKELLVRLHKQSVPNICFCFTNTRSK